jgi:D-glycero-D-manno-heptose 1,7-bisphosphate phosphatase
MVMKLALLSRDGVINKAIVGGVNHRTKLELISGSINAIVQLSQAGFRVIVVTHQPGISKGLFDLDELEAMNSEVTIRVEAAGGEIDAFFYCPHDEQDRCHCRPPEPGLLDAIDMEFDCNTSEAIFFFANQHEKALAKIKGCKAYECTSDLPLSHHVSHLINNT